jgi:hypothetical protein
LLRRAQAELAAGSVRWTWAAPGVATMAPFDDAAQAWLARVVQLARGRWVDIHERGESADAPGTARVEPGSAEQSFNLGEVVQAGARLLGKGPKAEAPPKDLQEAEPRGNSSAASKKAALAAIPLDILSPEHKQRATALLKASGFYRRLPKVTFSIEPEVYTYFLAHPDVAVSIWRAMKISKLEMWQTGRYDYEADAGDGSTGKLEVLHSGPEKCLIACDGLYKSPLFPKPIEAKSLLLLQTSFFREADGTVYVTHRADLFVEFPSLTVDVVAKIFSPLTVAMTDRTFSEISLFLKMMSLAMSRRPDWVEEIAGKMEGVPDIRKDQILELTAQVHTAAQKKLLERTAEKDRLPPGARHSGRLDGAPQPVIIPAAEVDRAPVTGPTAPAAPRSNDKPAGEGR